MDFGRLIQRNREKRDWRKDHPGPVMWVGSMREEHWNTFRPCPEMVGEYAVANELGPHFYHYIGRAMPRGHSACVSGSYLGNPFHVKRYGDEAIRLYRQSAAALVRGEVPVAYREMCDGMPFKERLTLAPSDNGYVRAFRREVLEVWVGAMGVNGLVLRCWCCPNPCHGDVVKRMVLHLHEVGTIGRWWQEEEEGWRLEVAGRLAGVGEPLAGVRWGGYREWMRAERCVG